MSQPSEKQVLISNVPLTKKEREYFSGTLNQTIIEPVNAKGNATDQVANSFQSFLDDCSPGTIKVCIFGTENTIEELSDLFVNSQIDHLLLVRTPPTSKLVLKWVGLTLLAGVLGYGLASLPFLS